MVRSKIYVSGLIIMLTIMAFSLNCTIGENTPTPPEDDPIPVEEIPKITTRAVSNITFNSAKTGGEIQLNLNNEIIDRGVCWSTHENPTADDNRTQDGTGHGNFSSQINALVANTKYYIRAFATSNAGTGYGDALEFTTSSDSNRATYTDPEGNLYNLVKIGDQWWMAENLKVTKYRNGDPISLITDNSEWLEQTGGACCYYQNDESNKEKYGLLYNWHAINDNRNIAPEGWHVPTDEEWKTMEMQIGMTQEIANRESWRGDNKEGGKLKESSLNNWYGWNEGSTNEYGFTALPGGYRNINTGEFLELSYYAMFWTSTAESENLAWNRAMHCENDKIGRFKKYKNEGFSIRCVMD